jgi:hypothetical protein
VTRCAATLPWFGRRSRRSSDPLSQPQVRVLASRATTAAPDTDLARWANVDIDLDDARIPAGDLVMLGLQQASDSETMVGWPPRVRRRPTPEPAPELHDGQVI